MVKLWHSLLPQAIVVYPHWKTMEIQAVKAEINQVEKQIGTANPCGRRHVREERLSYTRVKSRARMGSAVAMNDVPLDMDLRKQPVVKPPIQGTIFIAFPV